VAFEVDANGIVSVSATDKSTSREQQMRVTPTSGLSPEEIDRIITEAEDSADADKTTRERVDLQNKLAGLLKNTQRSFKEFGSLLSKDAQAAGQVLLKEGEAAAGSEQMGELRMALDGVERLAKQLTTAMLNDTSGAGS